MLGGSPRGPGAGTNPRGWEAAWEAAHVICAQHAPPHVTLIADLQAAGSGL